MIPTEIADLATLIYPDWPHLDLSEPLDKESHIEVMTAARRIHEAGYRKPAANSSPDGNSK